MKAIMTSQENPLNHVDSWKYRDIKLQMVQFENLYKPKSMKINQCWFYRKNIYTIYDHNHNYLAFS